MSRIQLNTAQVSVVASTASARPFTVIDGASTRGGGYHSVIIHGDPESLALKVAHAVHTLTGTWPVAPWEKTVDEVVEELLDQPSPSDPNYTIYEALEAGAVNETEVRELLATAVAEGRKIR